jgi:ATP-binding cassette, subfamily B, bacterial
VRGVRRTYIDPSTLPSVEKGTLRRILTQLGPYRVRVALVVSCIVFGAVLNLAPAWFVKQIVDEAIPRHDYRSLAVFCALMVAGPLVAGLLQIAQKFGAETIGQGVMFDLRVAIYRRLHEMPFECFSRQRPGEAITRVLNDVQGVGGVVSGTLMDVVQSSIVLVSTSAFILILDWRLGLLAIALLPLFVTPTRRVGRKRKALKRNLQARVGDLTGFLAETLSVSGALTIRVFGAEESEVTRLVSKADEIRQLSLQQTLVGRWFNLLLGLFESIGPALVFAVGGVLVIHGEVPLGTIVAFVALLKRLYSPASSLAGVHVDLITGYAYFERVFSMLDGAPRRRIEGGRELGLAGGDVEFKQVSFAYEGSGPSLSGVDLRIPAGKTVALVGPSGAGKSTMASLLAGLYDPSEGFVTIGGIDLKDINERTLRASTAIVTQDTFLFHATVLENLRYGKPAASRTKVEAAARQAQIHEVIAALPDGYDTVVGERGCRFSGGERQRLAIARALLKDPRILILDEATSSLDADAESIVQQALSGLRRGRTTLVITHRLSTIVDADEIVVLDRGRIVERGTHRSLLARPGLYAWLWRLHARATTTDQVVRPRPPHVLANSEIQAGSPFFSTPCIASTNVSISSSGV